MNITHHDRLQISPSNMYNLPYEQIGKNEPVCIADEVPFEIPDSWEWVRLKNIAVINPRNNVADDTDVAFIPMSLIKDGYRNQYSFEIEKWSKVKTGFTHFASGDIVIAKITPCFQNRKSAIINELPNGIGAGTTELHVVRIISNAVSNQYLLWLFKTPYFIDNGVKSFTGTAGQQRIGKEYVADFLIPIPPENEQWRIINRLHEVFPLCDSYDRAYESLSNLQEDFPAQLKKSILQQAVQGKLVPQDPADEPASVLLERIRAEKKQLIRSGKIKRDKHESVIYRRDKSHYEKVDGVERCIDDEIPFEIPERWEWCRIGQIFNLQAGKNISASEIFEDKCDGMYPCFGGNGKRGYVKFYNRDGYYAIIGRQGALCGNVNLADGKFYATEHAVVVETFGDVNTRWCGEFLEALNLNQYATATAQPGLAVKNINNVLIPLPPLREQQRIVKKIEELLPAIDTL